MGVGSGSITECYLTIKTITSREIEVASVLEDGKLICGIRAIIAYAIELKTRSIDSDIPFINTHKQIDVQLHVPSPNLYDDGLENGAKRIHARTCDLDFVNHF